MELFQGKSVASWKMMPISRRGFFTSVPASTIDPPVGCSSPAIIIKSVLLPQPLGPSSETNSPRATLIEADATACTGACRVK